MVRLSAMPLMFGQTSAVSGWLSTMALLVLTPCQDILWLVCLICQEV